MTVKWATQRLIASCLIVLATCSVAVANECASYAQQSALQNDRNVVNLCGFHGSQWSSDVSRWASECKTMSKKDQQHRLQMREHFLSQCALVSYPNIGRNDHQRKLSFALLKAVGEGSLRHTFLLLQAGANLASQPDELPNSPLYLAIQNKTQHLARFLVRNGAKPHLLAKGEMSVLSLLLYGKEMNHALFEFLLQNGANPNYLGRLADVDYPLVIAASKGDYRSVRLLLQYKADPNLYLTRSALQLAVEQDHYPIVRALINSGANPNLGVNGKRCDGVMALDLAFRNAKDRIIDLLMDNHALAERECKP
ncbi:ankyrin repeat domain-containing protein [Leucothrix sargassi]|nr:ankyrin repeat domain-containing protein [Leucothrix sargassi]